MCWEEGEGTEGSLTAEIHSQADNNGELEMYAGRGAGRLGGCPALQADVCAVGGGSDVVECRMQDARCKMQEVDVGAPGGGVHACCLHLGMSLSTLWAQLQRLLRQQSLATPNAPAEPPGSPAAEGGTSTS